MGVRVVRELVNVPIPFPSTVFGFVIVGLVVTLLQHIPREVIVAPPSPIILPPPVAVDCVIKAIGVVVVPVGIVAVVVENVFTSPYAVPIAFVAYALM